MFIEHVRARLRAFAFLLGAGKISPQTSSPQPITLGSVTQAAVDTTVFSRATGALQIPHKPAPGKPRGHAADTQAVALGAMRSHPAAHVRVLPDPAVARCRSKLVARKSANTAS